MAEFLRFEGLSELRRELRNLDTKLPRAVQKANKRVAELVTERARVLLASTGGSGPKAAQSLKAVAGQAYAATRLGGEAWPFAAGANFGSIRYTQFPPFKQKGEGDYGVYKAVAEKHDQIVDTYDHFLFQELRAAFPEGS